MTKYILPALWLGLALVWFIDGEPGAAVASIVMSQSDFPFLNRLGWPGVRRLPLSPWD